MKWVWIDINIDAGEKFYFGNLDVELPVDYNKENFKKLFTL